MNENLNLIEILKDCPKGTKLYLTTLGEVEFLKIDSSDHPICVRHKEVGDIWLTQEGKAYNHFDGECILFPSKEQRDWSKFKPTCEFKDGDILSYQNARLSNRTIYIYRYHKRFNTSYYVALSFDPKKSLMICEKGGLALNGYNDTVRFATEDEKKKLFQTIKDNGYKWNAETKTVEKLIKPKFDPKTLKPFDKVLIRRSSENYNVWFPDFVSDPPNGTNNKTLCMCVMEDIAMVIPYNDKTKHLVGTDDEAPEYYRYWED